MITPVSTRSSPRTWTCGDGNSSPGSFRGGLGTRLNTQNRHQGRPLTDFFSSDYGRRHLKESIIFRLLHSHFYNHSLIPRLSLLLRSTYVYIHVRITQCHSCQPEEVGHDIISHDSHMSTAPRNATYSP